MLRKQTQAIIPKQPTTLAPPALVEDLDFALHRPEGAFNVGLNDVVAVFVRLLGERREIPIRAGIVECDVDLAELLDGNVKEVLNLLFLLDINLHEDCLCAFFGKSSRDRLAFRAREDTTRKLCGGD